MNIFSFADITDLENRIIVFSYIFGNFNITSIRVQFLIEIKMSAQDASKA